ncbi:LCP family glycopolymer transferase [Neobacillus drentensis]|uniref:LCP family glycopolymer transferase n=1 Tax=Neobacillus drentensis TaxID=220684 RepID=UPI002FFEF43E
MDGTRVIRKKTKRRKPRWSRFIFLIIFICLIGGAIYFFNVYSDVAKAVDKMNKPLSRDISEKRETKVEFNNSDPISILMVGVDERKGDSGRTDSIIVITINPKTKTTKLLSIPRDTRTLLINKNNQKKQWYDKINAAYAYGGIEESIDTIENFLNIPIDYYIKVNMKSFADIVDAVGGIEVDNKYAFELDGISLKTGPQHLNGIEALEYARMRHQDPMGDFGRQKRQREVISKIIQKGKSFSTLNKYDDILEALEDNIKTNLTLNEMIGIQSTYKPASENMENIDVKGEGKIVDGIWYYLVDDSTRQELSDQLRENLGLATEEVVSTDQY